MGANLCKPRCVETNQGTVISIRSKCFEKPIKIMISEDDEDSICKLESVLSSIKKRQEQLSQERELKQAGVGVVDL